MKQMTEHDETGGDDRIDPIAVSLRRQAHASRLEPSAAMRVHTMEALRRERSAPPQALPFRRPRMQAWRKYASAAAMLALVAAMSWLILDRTSRMNHAANDSPVASGIGGAGNWSPPRFDPDRILGNANASVRLSSFTRPLENEAAALQSDLKRLTNRVRSALPKVPGRLPSPDATR